MKEILGLHIVCTVSRLHGLQPAVSFNMIGE